MTCFTALYSRRAHTHFPIFYGVSCMNSKRFTCGQTKREPFGFILFILHFISFRFLFQFQRNRWAMSVFLFSRASNRASTERERRQWTRDEVAELNFFLENKCQEEKKCVNRDVSWKNCATTETCWLFVIRFHFFLLRCNESVRIISSSHAIWYIWHMSTI